MDNKQPKKLVTNVTNATDRILAFEQGELDDESTIDLFQYLIDSGLAWRLQGSYGRTAKYLIEQGFCTRNPQQTGRAATIRRIR